MSQKTCQIDYQHSRLSGEKREWEAIPKCLPSLKKSASRQTK
jgi:hypothetical protein